MRPSPPGPARRSAPSATPLAKWLRETGTTQVALREACRSRFGLEVRPPVMSRWVRGQAVPNQHSRALIEKATDGGVPASAWIPLVRRARRAASPAPQRRRGAK